MGYRGPTAKIFILLSLLSLTFSAEPRKEEFVNHSVVKMFQMQPGSFPYSTNDAKGSKIYISSIDMCKIECPYGTMAAVETEPSTFYGSQSSISVWEPYLCTGRPPRYTGAVVVIQNGQSRIGAGWYVDPDMYGDNHAHFEIAWTNKDKSCTNLRCAGFIQLSNRIVPGAVLKPISTIDGKKYLIIISIFKIWDVWVLLFGEELVGYWPGELFTDLSGAANMIGWMGVGSAATGEPFPPMGSGYSPDEGEGRAAFFTDVNVIYSSTSKFVSPNLSEIFTRTTNPNCYQVGHPSSYDSGLHFFFGGAGCSPSQFIK
uniref:Neprosin PEP catalytic domain-containing protein n=1 Tax=Oryza nivara TaxID=4536 RepID=A0A0E0J0S8_ORYNI